MSQQDDIKDWFIHQLWPVYPGKWCRSGKGSRQEALNQMLKINPDQDERKRILLNLEAQIRADKGNQNRKWWSLGKTYVYNQMWEDPIEAQDEAIKAESRFCHCGQPTLGEKFEVCEKHTESHAARLKMMSILKEIGVATPGQSLQELSQSCREHLLANQKSRLPSPVRASLEKGQGSGNQ